MGRKKPPIEPYYGFQLRIKEIWVEDDGKGYHPEFWNGDYVQARNNCYNYATNRKTDSFAEPGRGAAVEEPLRYSELSCASVDPRARADGLKPHPCNVPCPGDEDIHTFLAIAPKHDFHWYRKHEDTKTWSHKRGHLEVNDKDFSDKMIEDPNVADRGPYTEACGCYCVPKDATIY